MISNRQLIFGIASFIAGSSLFTSFVTQIAQHNAWVIVLCAGALSLLVAFLYGALIARFPGNGLVSIHNKVYGKFLGYFINILYIGFFIIVAIAMLRNVSSFFLVHIMPETPLPIIMILMLLPCAFAVFTGIQNMLRCAFLFFMIAITITSTNFTLLISEMKLSNFLPLLNMGWQNYLEGTFSMASIPFCEIIVFLPFFHLTEKNTGTRRALWMGLLLGIAIMFLTIFQEIAVLGVSVAYLSTPAYESVRLINVMNVFTRLEILHAFLLSILHIFKLSIVIYSILQCIQDVFPIRKKASPPLLLSLGAVLLLSSLNAFKSGILLPAWRRNVGMFIFGFFEIVLPIITLCLSLIRRKKQTESE